jgi:hypothetical protein
MFVRLHSQATTTPKIRSAIQACDDPAWILSERYGISELTVLKWRHRDSVKNHSHSARQWQAVLRDEPDMQQSTPQNSQFFRPIPIGRRARSAGLLSMATRPSNRNKLKASCRLRP